MTAHDTVDAELEVRAGRRAPFTMVGDWVLLSGVKPAAHTLYWALSAHVSMTRGDADVWPTQEVLAQICGFSRTQSLTPYLDQLVEIGAIESELIRYAGNSRQRYRYTVHENPPEGYTGPVSFKDFYAARGEAEDGIVIAPKEGRQGQAGGEATAAAQAATDAPKKPRRRSRPKPDSEDAPAAAKPLTERQKTVAAARAKKAEERERQAQEKAAEKERKAEEEKALVSRAQTAANWWLKDEGPKVIGAPYAGNTRSAFFALRGMIRDALAAGYTNVEIGAVLRAMRDYKPQPDRFRSALAAERTGRPARVPAGRAPMYDDSIHERSSGPARKPTAAEIAAALD
ncbi:hypothetical protein [Actinacidiphila sp. bgisy160]|uniref:hypothetical protein n=1 Tax=Actinacidiphila sp. bgisy160 TaxID=3413796 RepID=UPI003D760DCA